MKKLLSTLIISLLFMSCKDGFENKIDKVIITISKSGINDFKDTILISYYSYLILDYNGTLVDGNGARKAFNISRFSVLANETEKPITLIRTFKNSHKWDSLSLYSDGHIVEYGTEKTIKKKPKKSNLHYYEMPELFMNDSIQPFPFTIDTSLSVNPSENKSFYQ